MGEANFKCNLELFVRLPVSDAFFEKSTVTFAVILDTPFPS